METVSILLAVVLGLPAVMALGIAGIQWYQTRARVRRWRDEAYDCFEEAEAEKSARVLLAWCDAQQAESRLGMNRRTDRSYMLRERPNYIAPDAFDRQAFRYTMGQQGSTRPATDTGNGFASVHLLLNDGAGHYFRVERRLCLN